MYRLFYVSTASSGLNDEEYDAILEASRRNNAKNEITGALVFNGTNFGQILEGEKEIVELLFDTIKKDKRHTGVIAIEQKPVSFRYFTGFSMREIKGLDFNELRLAMTTD